MFNFHHNFKFILDKRGFNYTSFARHLLISANFKIDESAIEKTRRKINRIANNQIKANIEDIAVFARILNVLPGLLAFQNPEKFKRIYSPEIKVGRYDKDH